MDPAAGETRDVTGFWLLPWLRGIKAYVYGFPLVMMDLTREAATAATAGEITAPANQFSVMTQYPDASFRAVARTGLDTLFAVAWADLERGAARPVRSGHRRPLLRHRALRHVEQRLRVDRQAHDGNRGRQLPDRRSRLAGHAARPTSRDVPVPDPLRVGQRADAGGRAAGVRSGDARCRSSTS